MLMKSEKRGKIFINILSMDLKSCVSLNFIREWVEFMCKNLLQKFTIGDFSDCKIGKNVIG